MNKAHEQMNEIEFQQVSALDAENRYTYFIKRVMDEGTIWGLRSEEGWVHAGRSDDEQALAIWSHPRFAEACALDAWSGCVPAEIDLDDFRDVWIDQLIERRVKIAVFPVPDGRSVLVEPTRVAHDFDELEAEYY